MLGRLLVCRKPPFPVLLKSLRWLATTTAGESQQKLAAANRCLTCRQCSDARQVLGRQQWIIHHEAAAQRIQDAS